MPIALVILLTLVPIAADADAIKAYVSNIAAAPAQADAVTKNCPLAILPNGELRKKSPAIRVADLLGADVAGVRLVVTRIGRATLSSTSMNEWFDAEVEARVGKKVVERLRLVGLGASVPPDFDRYEIAVLHWSKPIRDKDARSLPPIAVPPIKDETTPSPTGGDTYAEKMGMVNTGGGDVGSLLADGLAAWNMVVFGSAPRERYQGKKGAASVKAWKMKLAAIGGAYRTNAGEYCVASQFSGTTTTQPVVTTPYVGMVCYKSQLSGGGSDVVVPAFASFAIPRGS